MDKIQIFKQAKKLKGKTNNSGKKYFIQNELSEEKQEEDHWLHQLVAWNKESVVHKLNMSFKKNQLLIQNKPYAKRAPVPKMNDLLKMTSEERKSVQQAKLVLITECKEKCNIFKGYAAEVQNLQEI